MSGEIWQRPPLDRGRDDSSSHITLQLRPDSAATGPARWRSQLGRTEAALWRMVPSFREIKSHRPWRRWPVLSKIWYTAWREARVKKGQISLDCFKYRLLVRTACQCFFLLNLLPRNAFHFSGDYEGNLSFSYIFKGVFDSIWVCQGKKTNYTKVVNS